MRWHEVDRAYRTTTHVLHDAERRLDYAGISYAKLMKCSMKRFVVPVGITLGECIVMMQETIRDLEDHARFFFDETIKGCVSLDEGTRVLLESEILALLKGFDRDRLRNLVTVVGKDIRSRTLITKFLCGLFSLHFSRLCADALETLQSDAKSLEITLISPPAMVELQRRPLDEFSTTISDMDRKLPDLRAFLQRHRIEIDALDTLTKSFDEVTVYLNFLVDQFGRSSPLSETQAYS